MYISHLSPARKTKAEILGDAPAVKSRFVARNTVDWEDADGARHIRLHKTDVLTFRPNGAIEIFTGGWNTHTTRDRLNTFLPAHLRVWTHQGVLTVRNRKTGKESRFNQRAEIGPRGAIVTDAGKTDSALARDRKLIDSYMAKIRKLGRIPEPSGGDPWILPDPVSGKYGAKYVRDWLREKYVFGSLAVAAGRYAGLADMGIALLMFNGSDATTRRRIRRFLRACLGYCA